MPQFDPNAPYSAPTASGGASVQFDPNAPYSAAPVQTQPQADTLGNRVSNFLQHPFDTLTGAAPTPGDNPNDQGEQDKTRIWSEAADDFHKGNYVKAAGTLLDLFNPNKSAAAAQTQQSTVDAAKGFAKGVGQTAMTASQLGADIGTLGLDRVLKTQDQKDFEAKANDYLQPSNPDQQAGQNVESIVEFALGDEALKGLSLADRLAQGSKLAGVLEKYPRIANILGSSIRGATVGGTVGSVHDGTEGAISGAEGGALFGGGAAAIGELAGAAGNAVKDFQAAKATSAAGKVADAAAAADDGATALKEADWKQAGQQAANSPVDSAAWKAADNAPISAGEDVAPGQTEFVNKVAQNGVQMGIRQAASDAAEDAGVEHVPTKTIRDAFGTTARNVINSAKADFKVLDEASGGRWQRFADQIKNVQDKMSEVSGIDDDAYSNLEAKRNELETLQAQMVEDMKTSGQVDPAIADRATAQYKRGMALHDLNNAVRASSERVATPGVGVNDVVNPDKLALRVAKLNDVPANGGQTRIEQALGTDGAKSFLEHVDNSQLAAKEIKQLVPYTPEGKVALNKLTLDNTYGGKTFIRGKSIGKVDWEGVSKDFDALGKSQQQSMFKGDLPQVRDYIYAQARKQTVMKFLTNKWTIGGATALLGGKHFATPLIKEVLGQ